MKQDILAVFDVCSYIYVRKEFSCSHFATK